MTRPQAVTPACGRFVYLCRRLAAGQSGFGSERRGEKQTETLTVLN